MQRWIGRGIFAAALVACVLSGRAWADGIRQESLQIPAVIGGKHLSLEGAGGAARMTNSRIRSP